MRFSTSNEFLSFVSAYQRAWMLLLLDERVTAQNMPTLPVLLLTALLETAAPGNLKEDELCGAALKRVEALERDAEELLLN